MFAGFDQIVKDIWAKFPYICFCHATEAYVVHFHKWCWVSRMSGLALPVLFRYDHFDMTETPYNLTHKAEDTQGRTYTVIVTGTYKWKDIKKVVLDLGYEEIEENISAYMIEAVNQILYDFDDPEERNESLNERITERFDVYMEWINLSMNVVPMKSFHLTGVRDD